MENVVTVGIKSLDRLRLADQERVSRGGDKIGDPGYVNQLQRRNPGL